MIVTITSCAPVRALRNPAMPPQSAPPQDESWLDELVRQNREALTIFNNMLHYDLVPIDKDASSVAGPQSGRIRL